MSDSSIRTLYMVAMPLGCSEDLGRRAAAAIEGAEVVLCEDSRKLASVVQALKLNMTARVRSIPGDQEKAFPMASIEQFKKVVVCSDAGTPSINDPGAVLVRQFREAGWKIVAIPGPSAPIAAVQATGGFGTPFLFAGFAPRKVADCPGFFSSLKFVKTFCFFDTRHNLARTLEYLTSQDLLSQMGFCCVRELTKIHEEVLVGTVETVAQELQARLQDNSPLGEMTFLIEGHGASTMADAGEGIDLEDILLIRNGPPKESARVAAKLARIPASQMYQHFLEAKTKPKSGRR